MPSFQIEKSHINSCEAKIISLYCLKNNLKKEFVVEPRFDENTIPFGSVDFCEKFYGRHFLPNYYPEFLNRFISRKIWAFGEIPMEKCFIKPADKYKRFVGKISTELEGKERIGPYWCSEIVEFSKEWRVYVANGKILAQYFYLGESEDIPPPEVKVKFQNSFCGAVDFGMFDGRIELIESHHPFAIGWYGGFSEGEKYIEFLAAGHKYLLTLRKNSL
jgi:hypothetical protein